MAKHAMKTTKKLSTKSIVAIVAAAVIFCGMVGGTLAWLIDSTDPVVNTFTYGDINIKLDESVIGADGKPTGDRAETGNTYKMIPGQTITKDPIITVDADSEDCFVFVKIEESKVAKFSDYMEYTVDPSWAKLDGVDGVYYRTILAETDLAQGDLEMHVLAGDTVTVKSTVTKEMLNSLDENDSYPKLTFTGYAVQKAGMDTAAEAWDAINK